VAEEVIVHGHFYQPPRENPWTQEIDPQPSAAPFRDWNERVHAECYEPNTAAKAETPDGVMKFNNFERLSFDVGPTLLSWLEESHPKTYERILEADATSVRALKHGNAIAQSYHHTILPLSPIRDVRTEVHWGLVDFRRRFGRDSDGMWLPETAANDEVLGALIDAGVRFTVLAPWQASSWRKDGGAWVDARSEPADPGVPYRYLHSDGSGRELIVFFYDADIARQIAFEGAASSAERLTELFATADGRLVNAATDGETYGHHLKFGEIGLAYALFVEAERRSLEVTNYAAVLDQTPVSHEVRIREGAGTSWSCPHGVARWRRDCGCSTGGEPGWNQKWRTPLREALEVVRDSADQTFGRLGRVLFTDPWGARDRYIAVVTGAKSPEEFIGSEGFGDRSDVRKALALLEMQRNSMAMFTSCAWFFNDISGIETVQILRYAARTLELLEMVGEEAPAQTFLKILQDARSNIPEHGTGADIFRAFGATG
jgi:alpha-amylase/alpha-mannosidase (GH57 family)